jgi:hypothetical protein
MVTTIEASLSLFLSHETECAGRWSTRGECKTFVITLYTCRVSRKRRFWELQNDITDANPAPSGSRQSISGGESNTCPITLVCRDDKKQLSCPKLTAMTTAFRRNAAVALLVTEFAHSVTSESPTIFASQKRLFDLFFGFRFVDQNNGYCSQ